MALQLLLLLCCCCCRVCCQVNHRDEWLQCLRSTFDAMDVDKDGRLKPSEILEALRDKLPQAEVRHRHTATGGGCCVGLAGLLGWGCGGC